MTGSAEWLGPVGDVWAAEWARTDRSFAGLAPSLDAAIAPRAPATGIAVDIGCGAGATSLALAAARPSLHVTGVDLSPELIAVAARRGAGVANLSFRVGAAQEAVAALAPVDLFVSRHGVMFFADPRGVFTAFRAAAAPGVALVFSCFRAAALNPWASELTTAINAAPPASAGHAPGPFAFADAAFVRELLAASGWTAPAPEPVDFRYVAGAGDDPVTDAVDFFQRIGPAASSLRAAAPDARAAMVERITAVVARHRVGDVVVFPAAAWLWCATAS